MNSILIVTQKVDKDDDVLGFFHSWLLEFAKKWDQILVICLEQGEYSLPSNVKVFSLGKEKGFSKFRKIITFYKYVWQFQKDYKKVFVHMNQEYVLMAGLIWRMTGKKIFLWRNHPKGSIFTNIAVALANQVFCTSEFSYTKKFKKTRTMPAGIDTELFRNLNLQRKPESLLYLGRISPVKKMEIFIETLKNLDQKDINFSLSIYGESTPNDKNYYNFILNRISAFKNKSKIQLYNKVDQNQAVQIYNKYEILLNTTPTGSFDKVIIEMMATEGLVVTTNQSFAKIDREVTGWMIANENNQKDLEDKIQKILMLPGSEKARLGKELRTWVVENHSLKKLAEDLFKQI